MFQSSQSCPNLYITVPPEYHTNVENIESFISTLCSNVSCGPDLITAKMLKLLAHQIAPSLCQIFSQSLSEGKLPTEWKHAVTPIPKDGNKSLVSSYRPISLLSLPSKLLEWHVYNLLLDHLNSHNILSDSQFGFRSKCGTAKHC